MSVHTRGMGGLQDPVGFLCIGDDCVVPYYLQMARSPLKQWRPREVVHIQLCLGRHSDAVCDASEETAVERSSTEGVVI